MLLHLFFILNLKAHAEYRAFELVIYSSSSGQERIQISTLDPKQYRAYYPVKYDEAITYRATWMCRGNTALQPICARPEGKTSSPKGAPASLDQNSPP